MAAPAIDTGHSWDVLLRAWREVELPGEGWRAEIEEQRITLMPPPGELHNRIASRLIRILSRAIPYEWEIFETMGVQLPRDERLYVPDVAVFPGEVFPTPEPPVTADLALLLVEITSQHNADHDRKGKLWAYAHAPVPLYLLIDLHDPAGPSVSLYADPHNGAYRNVTKVALGAVVRLPEPFGIDLDTSQFPLK